MDKGATHVDVILLGGAQAPHDAAVDQQAQGRDRDHDVLLHRFRVQEALDAFVKDPHRERHQRDGVDESRQYASAVIAVRFDLVGGSGLYVEGKPGEQQRHCVGDVMAGVGQQRQTSCL